MKKILTFLCLLAATVGSNAQVRDAFSGILPVTDSNQMKCINGTWQLKVIEGIAADKEVPQPDDTWGTIPVPGCWEAYGFCKPSYDHAAPLTGYYRTAFTLPEAWRGQRVAIRFDGVLYGYDLFLNDRFVGSWRSGYNTAVFDLTPFLDRKASRQQLALRVVSQFRGSDFDYNDDWAPNGIFRDVTLMAVPDIHLADLTIHPQLTGEVCVDVQIAHADSKTRVEHDILDAQGRLVGHDRVDKPHLWTAETPYLYTLRTRLLHKGKLLQTFNHRFGFRQLTVEGNILKLNGTAIKLRGVTSHATDPRTAKVVSDSLTLHDMKLMKEASVNYIRTSHYPREPRFYELADSLGFYVIDEVPFGFGDKNLHDSTFYEVLQQRAQATVRRDKNHASVLIWSLGNENPLTDICIRLGDYVKRELDATRPVCYPQVGSYFRRFNYDFPKVADIYAPHYPTTGQLADFYQRADRPVVFTEYCHTLGISFEDHDRQWEIIERTPCIAGGSVWEWVDQGMPFKTDGMTAPFHRYGYEERVFTTADGGFEMFGNKGTDGLLYADRTPLPNYYELQHNYARAAATDSIFRGTLHIRNRYDFLNLKDNVTIAWTLTADRDTVAKGAFSPDCQPHASVDYPLQLPASPHTAGRLCLLQLSFTDAQGHTFLRQSLPVESTAAQPLAQRILGALSTSSLSPDHFFAEGPRIRAGRKATMAERLKVGDRRLEPYLLRIPAMGADIQTETAGAATHYTCTLSPDTTDTFLSELGIAFLLDRRIDRVQWIGQGPLPSYPGRRQANRYGFWAKQQGDLYFEGNRMGVDAALLTDREGNGLLILMNQGNVNFEQTDRGIVVSINAAVAGQGPKFARTAFPVNARGVGTVSTDFYVYSINADAMPSVLRTLFAHPQTVPVPFSPFLTQYDTYLMRYEDIAD